MGAQAALDLLAKLGELGLKLWLRGTDGGLAGTPSRMMASVKAAELCTCVIGLPLRNVLCQRTGLRQRGRQDH
jgi:hypothetical protein